MSRRIIELCLLAYPRTQRRRDGAYLRDLADELAETNGVVREAWSLLATGLSARARGLSTSRRAVPLAIAGAVAAAAVVAAVAVIGSTDTEVQVHSCVEPASSSAGAGASTAGTAPCTRLVILGRTMERDGWDCESQDSIVDGRRLLDLRCRLAA